MSFPSRTCPTRIVRKSLSAVRSVVLFLDFLLVWFSIDTTATTRSFVKPPKKDNGWTSTATMTAGNGMVLQGGSTFLT
eukprot:scaffold2044_cov305-Pavlova_lutheri.AAC.8